MILLSSSTINNASIEKILYLRFHIEYIYSDFYL